MEPVRPRIPWLATLEVALVAVVVLWDLAIPSLVVLVLAGLSLALRRAGPASLGFRRLPRAGRTIGVIVGLTLVWSVLQFGLVMPLLNRATSSEQDLSGFEELEGNLGLLVVLLVASWTLAAVGEEAAFRGYLLTRATEAIGTGALAVTVGVLVSSVLFGLLHTEQGTVGVVLSMLDAAFFAILRLRFRSVWAAVVAHGTSNTIGLVAVYLLGPVHGLW